MKNAERRMQNQIENPKRLFCDSLTFFVLHLILHSTFLVLHCSGLLERRSERLHERLAGGAGSAHPIYLCALGLDRFLGEQRHRLIVDHLASLSIARVL